MNSEHNYIAYKADQLLNDEYFLESEQHPTPESIDFWNHLLKEDQELAQEIRIARAFLETVQRIPHPTLSEENVNELWEHISTRNQLEDRKRKRRIHIYRSLSAACIILLLVGGWYLQQSGQAVVEEFGIESVRKPTATTNDIQLVLSENKQVAIQGKESQLQYDAQGKVNINSRTIDLSMTDKEKTTTYNQLIVPAGKRSTITFTDGTRIWLSANSRVVYPVEFREDEREIYIEGEAFLDVHHEENRPFIVKTSRMNVEVLGTTFNVCAYENESTQSVVLVSGKVKVNTNNHEAKILAPNQMLCYNTNNEINILAVDVQNYIAWKNGFYQFEKERLDIIAHKLSRYYSKNIFLDSNLKGITCSGKLDLKKDIDGVLKTLIKSVQIEVKTIDENIYINPKLN